MWLGLVAPTLRGCPGAVVEVVVVVAVVCIVVFVIVVFRLDFQSAGVTSLYVVNNYVHAVVLLNIGHSDVSGAFLILFNFLELFPISACASPKCSQNHLAFLLALVCR